MQLLNGTVVASVALLGSPVWAADIEEGKRIYQRNCQSCHGENGAGDGRAGRALRPRPTAFNRAEFWRATSDAKVKAAIKTGRMGTSMMGFSSLQDEQLDSVVAYMRTLLPEQ
jgi:high-affinity iron transporter